MVFQNKTNKNKKVWEKEDNGLKDEEGNTKSYKYDVDKKVEIIWVEYSEKNVDICSSNNYNYRTIN